MLGLSAKTTQRACIALIAAMLLTTPLLCCGRGKPPPPPKQTKSASASTEDDISKLARLYGAHDYEHARPLAIRLARLGNPYADYLVGWMYEFGKGVPRDYSTALTWFRRGAALDSRESRRSIGFMYDQGWGVPQDYAAAYEWYDRAARQGDPPAQMLLGAMYLQGNGTPQDNLLAHMWLSLAASSSDDVSSLSAKTRDALSTKLSPSELLQAQKMARICQQTRYVKCTRPDESATRGSATLSVPMQNDGGVYVVPVRLNEAITLNFVVDSGASSVSIPADVVLTLMRAGTIDNSDFIGSETITLADGSTTPSASFRIRSLRLGDITLQNVQASVGDIRGPLLLGQSVLGRFRSWSIDNNNHVLLLGSNVDASRNAADATAEQDSGPLQATSEARPSNDDIEGIGDVARTVTLAYFADWSKPGKSPMPGIGRYYADTVNYYGSNTSKQEVLRQKNAFTVRWPEREYLVRPTSLSVICASRHVCVVSGLVDWKTASQARNASSSGVAEFSFELADGLIDSESGRVVSRSSGAQ